MADYKDIAGRIRTTASDGVSVEAQEILDISKNKKQSQINAETDTTLANHASAIQGLNSQNYGTYTATDQTTAETDVLPAEGSEDTIYRLGNWDGTQYDVTCYSEYSWNGSAYVHISTKPQIGEVFDISAYHASGGTLATYSDLNDALNGTNGGIPQSLQKGGMSVKFVHSSDNKYVQYMLTSDTFTTNVSNWEECNSNTVEGKVFYVTDSNGYIIAKIDKDGVHSVDFNIGNEKVSVKETLNSIPTQILTAVNAEKILREQAVLAEEQRAKNEENKKLNIDISGDTFYFTDNNGYIIAKIDKDGIHSVNIDDEPNKIDNDNITIEDSNGYIIARIDKDGIHSAKDKHAVACMVLSESYYPTATPTRDSDGNVTYAQVMFETGITGSISITYTNGNSSSVDVVYGDYNYTITINRDSDGNVETVNIQ